MEQESTLVTAYCVIYKQNGSKIAFASNWSENYDILVASVAGGEQGQLSFD